MRDHERPDSENRGASSRGGRFFRLEGIGQDLRFAFRTLARSPGFTLAIVGTLALGIGANTAMFSLVNGVLLQPLPYESGERLVRLAQSSATREERNMSPLEIADYRQRTRTFTDLAEYHSMPFNLLGHGEPRRVQTGVVSAHYFEVLGVRPILGRTFRPGEDAVGAEPVLVLGHEFWQRELGGDPGIVGKTFEMNDRIHTVVGVLPPLPGYPDANDVYMPVSSCPFRSGPNWSNTRTARGLAVFGRLRPGADLTQANRDLGRVASELHAEHPDAYPLTERFATSAVALREVLTRDARATLLMLLGTAGLLLLIVCANVANLTLARLIGRQRELALRTALGAGRGRIVRQLLTESTVLALIGGLAGLAVAYATLDLLVAFVARLTTRAAEVRIDGSVLLFALIASVATGVLIGALPALSTRADLAGALKAGGDRASTGAGGLRLRGGLIVAQVAVSFMLLIGAGLMMRSFVTLMRVDAGFDAANVLTMRVDLNWTKYDTDEKRRAFARDLLTRVTAEPGVISAAVGSTFPLNGGNPFTRGFRIEGREYDPASVLPQGTLHAVSPEYFRTLGIPLLRGRTFGDEDRVDGPPVVLVNESMARHHWGARDPIGDRLTVDDGRTWLTIIGVLADVRQYGLDAEPLDELYVSSTQRGWNDLRLLVRTGAQPLGVARRARDAVAALDPEQPVTDVRTLEQVRSDSIASPRLTALLLGLFAGLALLISSTGIAGLIAYAVSQRRHEIGIRLALGAEKGTVLRMLVRQGLTLVAVGLAVGALGALAFTRLIAGLLFGVEPTDPLTYVAVAFVFLAVAGLSCLVPARRAMVIDPMLALRSG